MLPGKENRCNYQYDYICKFWFYIRCCIFGAFPNVRMLSLDLDAVHEFQQQAVNGDIAIVIWRSKNHTLMPDALDELLRWRKRASVSGEAVPRVRIGVFHIANEVNRFNWPWYSQPDFIIRNYWIPQMPPHVLYVPLGPQLPNQCTPRSTDELVAYGNSDNACHCQDLSLKRASKRQYTWNFSGSLRKRRAELLRMLRKSPVLRDRGYVQVSKKFGGNGIFGSIAENPKNAYLESILESQFVFAPCGNAMETHRVYEALSLGAIPVIENCDPDVSYFFPFRELLVNGGTKGMLRFVQEYADNPDEIDALQLKVMSWWLEHTNEVSTNVSRTVLEHIPSVWKWNP